MEPFTPAQTPSAPGHEPAQQRTPCPACRAIQEPGDRFCEECGADLQATHPLPAQRRPTPLGARCVTCATGVIDGQGYCDWCGRLQSRDRVEIDLGVAAGVSDRGRRRQRNEDALALRRVGPAGGSTHAAVAVVCDGVSSATCSDEAAQAAADAAADALAAALGAGTAPEPATRDAVAAALEAVIDMARPGRGCDAPACTYVSAVVTSTSVTIGWVGDSRAYWVASHDGHGHEPSSRLTADDSWAAEMVASGVLSEAEAAADRRAHAITAWLGPDAEELQPHVRTLTPGCDGVVVVCSDGLWNYLGTAEEIAAALPPGAAEAPLAAAAELVRIACEAGGHDNVTVAVLPFVLGAVAAPPASDRSAQR